MRVRSAMRSIVFITVALIAPCLVAAADYRVIVSNELSGDLTFIDGSSHAFIATVPVGKRPRGMHVSRDGRTLFVALSGSPVAGPGVDESKLPPADKGADGIGILDLEQRKLRSVLRGVSDPEQLVASRDERRLFVASEDTGQLFVLDASSGARLGQVTVGGEPEGLALSPDGRVVYVASEADHQVTVVDASDLRVLQRFSVGERPRSIAFDRSGTRAYVTGESDASLTVIDAGGHKVLRTVKLAGENVRPMGLQVSSAGDVVYVSTGRGGTVLAVDAKSERVRGSVAVGPRPWGIALSPDGGTLYSANGPSNDVAIVDTRTLRVLAKVPVGTRPWGVAIAKR